MKGINQLMSIPLSVYFGHSRRLSNKPDLHIKTTVGTILFVSLTFREAVLRGSTEDTGRFNGEGKAIPGKAQGVPGG